MVKFYFYAAAELALAPAAVHAVLPHGLLVDLVALAGREEVGRIDSEAREALLHVGGHISSGVGLEAHGEGGNDIVLLAGDRVDVVDACIMVHHLLAELIAFLTHEEGGLETENLVSGIYLLEERGESLALLGEELVEAAVEEDVAVHVHAAIFPHSVEAHHVAGKSPAAGVERLVDKRHVDGAGGLHIP